MANEPTAIDARLTHPSQDALISSFQNLTMGPTDLPLRPNFGTAGTEVKLRANFFPVKVPKGPLYEYDVTITPVAGTAIRRVRRRIFQLAENSDGWTTHGLKGRVAHDHASKLIAATMLPQPLSIEVPFYDEDQDNPTEKSKVYTLSIQFTQEIETRSLVECVLASILKSHTKGSGPSKVSRRKTTVPSDVLGLGLSLSQARPSPI